mmetsp:Transcript_41038/g.98267  ORF Transcript_41038/g.98267 Transcript_41038/m.98267 type:complete len:98 (+) Transcript_41038:278-571(+)
MSSQFSIDCERGRIFKHEGSEKLAKREGLFGSLKSACHQIINTILVPLVGLLSATQYILSSSNFTLFLFCATIKPNHSSSFVSFFSLFMGATTMTWI